MKVAFYAFLNAGGSAIAGSGLEKVIIPEGIRSIGTKAFAYWDSGSDLNSLYLPNSLTSIGTDAFLNCKALKTAGGTEDNVRLPVQETLNSSILSAFPWLERVTVPAGTKSIAGGAFSSLPSLKNVTLSDGVETIADKAFSSCASLTYAALPNSVTSIGASAFEDCTALKSVSIPAGVSGLNSGTFNNCTSLKRVSIHKNLKTIAMSAFNGCTSLEDVYFNGTEDEWNAIAISPLLNDPLMNAAIHYAGDPFIPVSASFASVDYDGNDVAAVLTFDQCDSDLDVFVAVYQDGRMIKAASATVSEGAGSSTVSIPVNGLSGEYQVKAFFLDIANCTPLVDRAETKLTA